MKITFDKAPHLLKCAYGIVYDGTLMIVNLKGHAQGCKRCKDVAGRVQIKTSMYSSSQWCNLASAL